MKRRIVSVCCAMALILDMLILSVQTVAASDTPILDGSYLTHEEESIGYDTKITRGVDLMAGYSKLVRLGAGKVYAGGTTLAAHDVDSVRLGVIVEYADADDDHWTFYETWDAEAENTDRIMDNRALAVEGGHYYRVRCYHSANDDVSSSFTDGIFIEEP